jgi:hypothetical protein
MPPPKLQCPVDGHVHFHSLDRVEPTLNAAAAHFRALGERTKGLLGALLLTQTSGERVFESLQGERQAGAWTIAAAADEPESLIARRDGVAVAIVCGRQVRAADGLEVLGLGTCQNFPDGLPFTEAVERVHDSGALTVLPWGFGKWVGERGRRVEHVLDTLGPGKVFLGDNGNRLAAFGLPGLIRTGEREGFRVLPGTDPFPLSGTPGRVGAFGFCSAIEPPAAAPWRALRQWLVAQPGSPPAYGNAVGPLRFVLDQVGLRLQKKS